MISEKDINDAHARITPYIHHTPILTSSIINELAGCNISFKCENFQRIGAFKMRGAANMVLQLSNNEKQKGIITHSSGNHGQAVAKMGTLLNIPATIVMPKTAPSVKVNAVKQYNATIVFCEPTLKSRESTMHDIVANTGATFIPPYNHKHIITGQATACKELINDTSTSFEYMITPVGGGGLLAGSALSTHYFSPQTTILAAEPEGADDAYRSFKVGKLIPSKNPNTIADGLLTSLGNINYDYIKKYVHDIFLVTDAEIKNAMKLIWQHMKIIIEPSSATALALVLKNKPIFKGKQVGIILSGGNVDFKKISF